MSPEPRGCLTLQGGAWLAEGQQRSQHRAPLYRSKGITFLSMLVFESHKLYILKKKNLKLYLNICTVKTYSASVCLPDFHVLRGLLYLKVLGTCTSPPSLVQSPSNAASGMGWSRRATCPQICITYVVEEVSPPFHGDALENSQHCK